MGRQQVTITALANGTGIPKVTMHRRVGGLSPFNIDELGAVAEFLGKPVLQFLPSHLEASA